MVEMDLINITVHSLAHCGGNAGREGLATLNEGGRGLLYASFWLLHLRGTAWLPGVTKFRGIERCSRAAGRGELRVADRAARRVVNETFELQNACLILLQSSQ